MTRSGIEPLSPGPLVNTLVLVVKVIIVGNIHIYTYIYICIYKKSFKGGARGVMETVTRVQILDETDGISHTTNTTNTIGKGMNSNILPPVKGE